MELKRIHWIDIAKGIGIIFIIYAHMLGGRDYRYLFYSFHIPLFFFLSGVVYNHKKYLNFFTFLRKSAKGLLLPYLIFAFISFLLWLSRLKPDNLFSTEIIKQFLSIFYGNSNNSLMIFNNILWFLPALFVTKILFALITKFSIKTKILIFALIFFSVFGYLFSIYAAKVKLPFGTETAFSGVVFYGLGFLWNQSEKAKSLVYKYKYFLFVFLLITGSYISTIDFHAAGHQIDMRLNHLNNYFYFYLGAFSGIFTWIAFSMILNKNRLLELIGRNSLILFAWHPIVFIYIGQFLSNFKIINSIKIFIPLLYTILSITIILFVNSIIKRLKSAFESKPC